MRGGGAVRPPAWKSGPAPFQEESKSEAVGRSVGGGARKKGAGVLRSWMMLDSTGQAQVVEAGKHSIMRRTGLPGRDLRILDPLLSYPSTVLGREKAIVINLEHIKAIITAQEVLLLNFKDPAVAPFVHELQRRLQLHHLRHQQRKEGNADWTNEYDLETPRSPAAHHEDSESVGEEGGGERKLGDHGRSNLVSLNKPRDLPFEFVALEACLEAACSCLENEAATLEKEAHPALDKLASKISTLNLEHVRQIKSRLVAISGRVQKVRDEFEQLLDDDDDMAEMYLTDKLSQQHLSAGSSSRFTPNEQGEVVDDERIRVEISSEEGDIHNDYDQDDARNIGNHDRLLSRLDMINEGGHGTCTYSTRSGSKHVDVEELEMLLEAYFVQIDSTLNNLSTLREYVDDTEDYINIMLDDKQNHLLQMGVVLTTATLIVSAFVVLAGIFGMNIKNDLFDEKKTGTKEFLWTIGGGATGSLFLYAVAMAWCKHKRLLE